MTLLSQTRGGITMGCSACKSKGCRTEGKDCFGIRPLSLAIFQHEEIKRFALNASRLIDHGRAGTLDRLEEIIEYCHSMNYRRIGVAYCFGMPEQAKLLKERLKVHDLFPVMVQCTTGSVLERDIDPEKNTDTVSCNPAGQALALKKKGADFVIEMGLCMGHDVIFHETLEIPFTTYLVKDRIHNHSPIKALGSAADPLANLLSEFPDPERAISPELLCSWLHDDAHSPTEIVDLRDEDLFQQKHFRNSIHIPIKELPLRYRYELPNRKDRLVLVHDDSVASAYALAFLTEKGFRSVYQLTGSISDMFRRDETFCHSASASA